MESFSYICFLLLLVFYIFAVIGFYQFSTNDPAHFGSVGAALVSLFRAATLAAWYELMWINWYGCAVYPGGAYVIASDVPSPHDDHQNFADVPDRSIVFQHTVAGSFPQFICSSPKAQPASSGAYFICFTLLSGFVILSLLVGVVTIAMQAAMQDLQV